MFWTTEQDWRLQALHFNRNNMSGGDGGAIQVRIHQRVHGRNSAPPEGGVLYIVSIKGLLEMGSGLTEIAYTGAWQTHYF